MFELGRVRNKVHTEHGVASGRIGAPRRSMSAFALTDVAGGPKGANRRH
jgi:hypothetical protein